MLEKRHSPLRQKSVNQGYRTTKSTCKTLPLQAEYKKNMSNYSGVRESKQYIESRQQFLMMQDQFQRQTEVSAASTGPQQDRRSGGQEMTRQSNSRSISGETEKRFQKAKSDFTNTAALRNPGATASSSWANSTAPKRMDTGGYAKHPVRGPDTFSTKPRKQLETVITDDLPNSQRVNYSSLRQSHSIQHANSVLEKARSNRMMRENQKRYDKKVNNYIRDQKSNSITQEIGAPYRTIYNEMYLQTEEEESLERETIADTTRQQHSKSVQGTRLNHSKNEKLNNSEQQTRVASRTKKQNMAVSNSKYSVQMSESTAVTKSVRLNKFKKRKNTEGNDGFSESRKVEDISMFDGRSSFQDLQSKKSLLKYKAKPKEKPKNRSQSPRELQPQHVGYAKNIQEKTEPPKKMSLYQQRIQEKYERIMNKTISNKYHEDEKQRHRPTIDIEIQPKQVSYIQTPNMQSVIKPKSILKESNVEKQPQSKEITFKVPPKPRSVERKISNVRKPRESQSPAKSETMKCPYHGSPTRMSTHANDFSPASGKANISYNMMCDSETFDKQSLLYRATHRKFMFTKPKIGSRADRVYSYYANDRDWRADKYLHVSQEADNKTLQSREGRKLELSAYHKRMTYQPLKKDPKNIPCKLISTYVPPTSKKHGSVIQSMRDKMLRNSSMVAQVTVGMPRLKPKKSLQKVEIGSKSAPQVKKLMQRHEIGGHVAQEYRSRIKKLVD